MSTISDTCRYHLKTHCFQWAFQPTHCLPLAPQIWFHLIIVHVYKLLLLTYLHISLFGMNCVYVYVYPWLAVYCGQPTWRYIDGTEEDVYVSVGE